MLPNPILKKLGYSDSDRLVILHCDDVGMCHSTLPAFEDLVDFGLISSGAVMVPCPWFPQAAAYARHHSQVDLGVHLTLTSEWDSYRWGPLASREKATGLLDEEGYFYRQVEPVQENGDPVAVENELRVQIMRASRAGVQATHVDTHMGAIVHPKFIHTYIQLAVEFGLPPMILRLDEKGYRDKLGFDEEMAAIATQTALILEDQGLPLLDNIVMLPLDQPENRIEQAREALENVPAGLTHFIIHPAQDTPELRAIAPDWQSRVADYQSFTDPLLKEYVQNSGLQVIGYRLLRDLMRDELN